METTVDISKMDIPSLPVVAVKVMRIAGSESASSDELVQTISGDQSFATRVLKIANSPFFSRKGGIDSIDDAVLRIGFETVRTVVVMSVLKDMSRKSDAIDFNLWEHNTAVSFATKIIAERLKIHNGENLLIHGLLHDIGKNILNLNFKEKYAEVVDIVTSVQRCHIPLPGRKFAEVENEFFGQSHCQVGYDVARKWGLPDQICKAILHHHSGPRDLARFDHASVTNILIVQAADYICYEMDLGINDNFSNLDETFTYIGLARDLVIAEIKTVMTEDYPEYRSLILGR